ncbi:MAG: hypothetical protein HYX26_02170 [Acidobacteriales bacterium]|nr:hypothetical protein [Terriglobales bacterium]
MLVMRTAALLLALAAAGFAQTKKMPERVDASTPREVQIALAESAAPKEVSGAATILVLGKKGYEVARKGANGFTCMVLRQRPDTLEPECYDAEGSATTLKADMFVEEQRAKDVSEADIAKQVETGYKSKRFLAPRRPGIVYMMSRYNRVFDPSQGKVISFPGHLMFYAPYLTAKDVGDGKGAPYLTSPGKPDNLMVVVPAGH